MRLEDKVALITGAGSGIGRESAILFSREGAAVVCVDLNEDAARGTEAEHLQKIAHHAHYGRGPGQLFVKPTQVR